MKVKKANPTNKEKKAIALEREIMNILLAVRFPAKLKTV